MLPLTRRRVGLLVLATAGLLRHLSPFASQDESFDATRGSPGAAIGEGEQRLYGLDAWRESGYYTDRERARLAWVEAVTRVADGHVSDATYADARAPRSATSTSPS